MFESYHTKGGIRIQREINERKYRDKYDEE